MGQNKQTKRRSKTKCVDTLDTSQRQSVQNDPCSSSSTPPVQKLTQPASSFSPTAPCLYSSVAEVPRTSPFWRIWCEIQEWIGVKSGQGAALSPALWSSYRNIQKYINVQKTKTGMATSLGPPVQLLITQILPASKSQYNQQAHRQH